MTFLEILLKQGYQSINDYLDSIGNAFADSQDFTERELKAIKRAEAATEAYLEVVA